MFIREELTVNCEQFFVQFTIHNSRFTVYSTSTMRILNRDEGDARDGYRLKTNSLSISFSLLIRLYPLYPFYP